MRVAEEFAKLFREEHRQIRDTLLDLLRAFQARDRARVQEGLKACAGYTGPHFRYEEESLYPALIEVFGEEYVNQLYRAHDGAIGAACRLIELAEKADLTEADIAEARRLILGILPHVSDCEGLSIMVEILPEEKVRGMLDTRDRALREGLDLIQWSTRARGRPPAPPA
jgi:hypothetical protein